MLATSHTYHQFSPRLRNRLENTIMGLGLVRLLQDAGMTEEARATLSSLEHGFQGDSKASASINIHVADSPLALGDSLGSTNHGNAPLADPTPTAFAAEFA